MHTISKFACAVLSSAALFGATGFSAVANAAEPERSTVSAQLAGDGDMSVASTRGFWIENRTSERLKIVGVDTPVRGGLLPEDSWSTEYIEPGQTTRVEVTSGYFDGGHDVLVQIQGDKPHEVPAKWVPPYTPGPEAICGDDGDPRRPPGECDGYWIPAHSTFGEASVWLNVWGLTRTSFVMKSDFGAASAGGEAIVLTDTPTS